MTLIVEDGSNVAGSESYESVTNADTYHSNRGNTAWAALATPAKEQALRKATDYMGQAYRTRWAGYRTHSTQSLDWPRSLVEIKDTNYIGTYVDQDSVPDEIKKACCELALMSLDGSLAPNVERETASESVGEISVSYFQGSTQHTVYRAIDLMIKPYLRNSGSGIDIVRA